jgi:eukaryotic-like serine/threonine-protein kinase
VVAAAGEAVGAVLNGQWRLLRLIGEGGLAAVYEAESTQGQGKRAIKLLHAQFTRNRAIVERFYAEAKACFTLKHPHVAGVEAYAYAEDGSPYIVMELLHGMSVEQFLKRHQPMTPAMAAPLTFAMLQALSVAHGRGIVHRDLKPANLFLVPNAAAAGQFTIKVLDFGIAKVMDVAGGIGTKTRTGAVLGTPGYMSPEQVKDAKAVDARTDLWAVGVVFYEMMTGEHPYGSNDQLARMVAVLRDGHTPISAKAPHLAAWDPFFEKALAKDPAARFQSAEEMGEALRHMAQGTPARFVPDGLQTVAIPQMQDMRLVPGALPPSAVQASPAVGPTTSMSPAVAPHTVRTPAPASSGQVPPQPGMQGSMPPQPSGMQPSGMQPSGMQGSMSPQPSAMHPPGPSGVPAQSGYSPAGVSGLPGYPSEPPPAYPAPPGPQAYRPGGGTRTQISEGRPSGTPSIHSDIPPVRVETARDEDAPALVWWAVVLLATGTFALGIMLGYVLAG